MENLNKAINLLFENGHLSFSRNNRVFYLNEKNGALTAVRGIATTAWAYDDDTNLYKTSTGYYLIFSECRHSFGNGKHTAG